jgi:hypothetical protein
MITSLLLVSLVGTMALLFAVVMDEGMGAFGK